MATLVQNQFDAQPPKPKNTGIVAGAMPQSAPQPMTTMQAPASPTPSVQLPVTDPAFVAERPAVDKATETTSGQLDSILAGDSPLMQRARAIASQQSNARGLLNSSMNAEAGTAAMIDRATPIANADANVYDTRTRSNADAGNSALSQGANIKAQMALQQGQQSFQSGESALDRQQQTNLQDSQQKFQSGESSLDRAERAELQDLQQKFQANQSSLDRDQQQRLQDLQQKFQGEQSGLDRTQQTEIQQMQIDAQKSLTDSQQKFSEIQAQLDRTQQVELTKLQASLQSALNDKSLAPQFAANVASGTMNAMQAILANADLTPESKRAAIDNLIAVANQQLAWGSTFYNTKMPPMGTPGTSTTPYPWVPLPGGIPTIPGIPGGSPTIPVPPVIPPRVG